MTRRGTGLAAVFALAVLAAVAAGATHPPGLFPKYLSIARASPAERTERALDVSPLYLAITRALEPAAPAALLWVNVLLLGVAAAAGAAAVTRLAGPARGLTAGLLVATYRPFLVACGVLEPEVAILAALSVAVLAGVRARSGLKAGDRALLDVGLASAALGAAVLLRPSNALLVPAWAAWLATAAAPARRGRVLLLAVGLPVLVVAPVAVARSRQAGFPVLMNPGPVFYEGNGPGATGVRRHAPAAVAALERLQRGTLDYAHVAYRRIAASVRGRPVNAAEANRYWAGLAAEHARAEPRRFAARILQKLVFALMPYEAHDLVVAEDLDRRVRAFLPWGFVLLLPVLAWIVAVPAARLAPVAGPLSIAAVSLAVQLIFYASARQRLPLALGLLLAAPVLVAGGDEPHRATALRALAGLLLAAALAGATSGFAVSDQAQWDGVLAERGGRLENVARLLDGRLLTPALERDEARRFFAAVSAFRQGRQPSALHALSSIRPGRDFTADDVTVGVPEYWRALSRLAEGDREAAALLAAAAESVRPGTPEIAALAARLERPLRDAAESDDFRLPGCDPVSARWNLVRAAAAENDGAGVVRLLSPLRGAFPELGARPPWASPPPSGPRP